jgi:hypothetical protein
LPGKPDEEWKPPRRPDIILPEEPDQIPPISPIPEPTRDVPPPAQLAPGGELVASTRTGPNMVAASEPAANLATGPDTEPTAPITEPDTKRLPPVDPPDEAERVPGRVHRRRQRTDSISIADLLTEALVAYQATSPNDDEEEPSAEPAEPAPDTTAPARRLSPGSGRHRMPDWGNV